MTPERGAHTLQCARKTYSQRIHFREAYTATGLAGNRHHSIRNRSPTLSDRIRGRPTARGIAGNILPTATSESETNLLLQEKQNFAKVGQIFSSCRYKSSRLRRCDFNLSYRGYIGLHFKLLLRLG